MIIDKKNISLEELKNIELGILKEVHNVCIDNGFRYSLAGGTLLGAVRHGGFIPWDDDIDILMPRPDYNKLIEFCKNNSTPFKLICHETIDEYSYLFAKVINPNTVIKEEGVNRDNIDLGVYIDIFPIDGLADDYEKAKKKFNISRFKRELLVAYNWKKYFRSKTKSWIYEPIRLAMFFLSRFVQPKKLINKIQSQYSAVDFEKTEYAGCVCGAYRTKEIVCQTIFTEYTDIEFEGNLFKCVKQKEEYLTHIYGNYMQLPPKEKQVSHHTFEAFWK